jgi:hypothetical protein
MKRVFFLLTISLCISKADAQSVGIGTTNPNSNDLLHISAAPGINGLLVQIRGADKFRVNANGGTSIGSSTAAPSNGLYVTGVTNPFGGIRSATNPINIQSTNDSVEIVSGTNRIVVFANGGIKIVTGGGTNGITIDAGIGDLVLKGANVNVTSTKDINIDAGMNVNAQADMSMWLSGGMDMQIKSNLNASIEASGGILTLKGSALTKINGGLITLNDNGSPAARINDLVNVPLVPTVAKIMTGSNTVLIGN